MVDIYLLVDSNAPLHLLSVPSDDIQRLSYRPLKWLRFVTFAICGARGDLLQSHNGPIVNYETTLINDVVGPYYYWPIEPYVYVDYNVLNDRITSSAQTQRRHDFCEDVIERDGQFCIITQHFAEDCDASHIIPKSKGDEYIHAVTRRRAGCYNLPHLEINDINAAENGILLTKTLHARFGRGAVAFLKTPNFALNPEDIPRVEGGPMPSNRITLQNLEPPRGVPIPPRDAVFRNMCQPRDGNAAPAALLLDFMYGAAAYKHWGNGSELKCIIHDNFVEEYQSIPILQKPVDLASNVDSGSERGDSTDGDYDPFSGNHNHFRSKPLYLNCVDPGREFQSNRGRGPRDSMIKAMDSMNALMMCTSGITPKARAAQWQQEEQERQLKDKEFSQSKVFEWMK